MCFFLGDYTLFTLGLGVSRVRGPYEMSFWFGVFRYSAVRRQFGPTEKDEIPVLEYQMQVGEKNKLPNVDRRVVF